MDNNQIIKNLFKGTIPEKYDEFVNLINNINFYFSYSNSDNNGYSFSSVPSQTPDSSHKIKFTEEGRNLLWLTSYEYGNLLFDERYSGIMSAIKCETLSEKQKLRLFTIHNCYGIRDMKDYPSEIQREVYDILSDTSDKKEIVKSPSFLEYYEDNISRIEADLNKFKQQYPNYWPSDIPAPDKIYEHSNDARIKLALFALSYVLLHEINHCINNHPLQEFEASKSRVQEKDCDKFATNFITSNVKDYFDINLDNLVLLRCLGCWFGFLFIMEDTGRLKSEFYPELRERAWIILNVAESLIKDNNDHFWIICATTLYAKLRNLGVCLPEQYASAKDLAQGLLINLRT